MNRSFLAFVFLWQSLTPHPADAHQVGLSYGTYSLEGDQISAEIILAARELAFLAEKADRNEDGTLSEAEARTGTAAIQAALIDPIVISTQAGPCTKDLVSIGTVEGDGIATLARFDCKDLGQTVAIDLGFLPKLEVGHRHLVVARFGGSPFERVAHVGQEKLEVPIANPTPTSNFDVIREMVVLGVEHIVTGYDHLAFLLGLVLLGGALMSVVAIVTSFTIAHSLTLGAATLGLMSPSPSLIEPIIALSVAYVGFENLILLRKRKMTQFDIPAFLRGRWKLTFAFGLIHGFGFAGALGEIGLPKDKVPLALVTFNVGVELGQLAVLAFVLPILSRVRKVDPKDRSAAVLSFLIFAAGAYWCIDRVFG